MNNPQNPVRKNPTKDLFYSFSSCLASWRFTHGAVIHTPAFHPKKRFLLVSDGKPKFLWLAENESVNCLLAITREVFMGVSM